MPAALSGTESRSGSNSVCCYNNHMTLRGHIEKRQVVLDEPADLPDGTAVAVQVYENGSQRRGSAAAIVAALRTWEGPPGELDRLLAEVQQMRDEDVLPRRNELE